MKLLNITCGVMALTVLALSGCGSGDDSQKAQIRLLNVSTGYDSLDLYVNNDDDDSDTLALEAVDYETASEYAKLDSDTYTIKFKRNGVTGTLQTLSEAKLTDESHATYVAYGSSGHFAAVKIDEDESDPDSGEAKVQVLNTAEAGALDVYLTDASVSLDDASPTFGSVASGGSGSIVTLDNGSYRLRITGAGEPDDLRFDVSDLTLDSEQVASLILTATEGGVLVNVIFLPQQGTPSTYKNTKARVRGAVGISTGTAVTASVGGVDLLTSQPVGVIGSTYQQIDAGTAAVELSVDGTDVAVSSKTLVAGADYTLLVWDNASGTQTTLISDDNRLPTASGKAKIRLMNGMSGLGDDTPITLSVDYSPLAEAIELGKASAFTEIDSGSEYQLDVTNSSTGTPLLSRSSISLQAQGVYTMFTSGGGAATVGGTLRKDR